jgi:hypothetical protein
MPIANEQGLWSVAVRVTVSAEALLLLPSAEGRYGSWETGALMYRDEGGGAREFLARSRLSTESTGSSDGYIVHQRTIEALRPGSWSLGAFVRDRNANIFGGAEGEMLLPRPGRAGISTPVMLQSGHTWIRTELPLLKKKKPEPTRTGTVMEAPLPLADEPVSRGAPVEARTWICAPRKGDEGRLLRYLVKGEEPLFRFEHVDPPPAGACSELVDVVETGLLAPGEYAYRIRYTAAREAGTLEDEVSFVVE